MTPYEVAKQCSHNELAAYLSDAEAIHSDVSKNSTIVGDGGVVWGPHGWEESPRATPPVWKIPTPPPGHALPTPPSRTSLLEAAPQEDELPFELEVLCPDDEFWSTQGL